MRKRGMLNDSGWYFPISFLPVYPGYLLYLFHTHIDHYRGLALHGQFQIFRKATVFFGPGDDPDTFADIAMGQRDSGQPGSLHARNAGNISDGDAFLSGEQYFFEPSSENKRVSS